MMKRSAGILPYKIVDKKIMVYLEHPGGPYWQDKDEWSICKGEYKRDEKAVDAAVREFKEETGFSLDKKDLFFIKSVKQQATNKLVIIFGVETDIDPEKMTSNTFIKEWPPFSGQMQEFLEMDQAKWFSIEEARKKIFKGQKSILTKLEEIIYSVM